MIHRTQAVYRMLRNRGLSMIHTSAFDLAKPDCTNRECWRRSLGKRDSIGPYETQQASKVFNTSPHERGQSRRVNQIDVKHCKPAGAAAGTNRTAKDIIRIVEPHGEAPHSDIHQK